MEPERGYPMETSSNPAGVSGLSDPSDDPWTPDNSDDSPTVTVIINKEDTYIESATITGTENVESVTVVIEADDGSKVCFTIIWMT
jgi:hypothetical protein